ncbi:unnamed protein product [Discosporangium mesarthrocarpum]
MVGIPKVACTQFHQLFLRMQGSKGWNSKVLGKVHFHKDKHKYTLSSIHGMNSSKATVIMNDPTWTRAVFLRDPAERFLSCYLDKIVHRKSYSVKIFQSDDVISFERFVDLCSPDAEEKYGKQRPGAQLGLSHRTNGHWRPQSYFGLDKFLPYFDFIGDFRHIEEHSRVLLEKLGLWDEYGASGWGPKGSYSFFQRSTVKGHATGSRDAKSLYYTQHMLQRVQEAYAVDYEMLERLGMLDPGEDT